MMGWNLTSYLTSPHFGGTAGGHPAAGGLIASGFGVVSGIPLQRFRRRSSVVGAIMATSLVLVGCNPSFQPVANNPNSVVRQAAAPANPDASVYPLTVGTGWTYRLTNYRDGVVSPTTGTMTSTVTSVEDRDGVRVAKVERTYGSTVVPATEARVLADGVMLARWPEPTPSADPATATRAGFVPGRQLPLTGVTARDGDSTAIRVLSFPLQAGTSWPGRSWSFAKETITAVGWDSLSVPAGTYRSWHVAHRIAYDDGRQDNLGYWYAPNVGMVKAHEETSLVDSSGRTVRYAVDGELTAAGPVPTH